MKAHEDGMSWTALEKQLEVLQQACESGETTLIKAVLQTCVQGYGPQRIE